MSKHTAATIPFAKSDSIVFQRTCDFGGVVVSVRVRRDRIVLVIEESPNDAPVSEVMIDRRTA